MLSVIKARCSRCVAAVAYLGFMLLYLLLLVCLYIIERSGHEFLPRSTFFLDVCVHIAVVAVVRHVLRKGTKEFCVLVTS